MKHTIRRGTLVAGVVAVALLGAACGRAEEPASAPTPGATTSGAGSASLVGPGSVAVMAADPVAVAASDNPMLTTLVSALSGQLDSTRS